MFMLLMVSCVLVMFLLPTTMCLRRVLKAMIFLWVGFMLPVGCSRPQPAVQTQTRNLNVLLITLDTTRADHLSCYNAGTIPASNRGARTPHLDALASLCRQGFGEVEVHLHHDGDCAEALRERLRAYKNLLAQRHQLLSRDREERVHV